MYVFGISVVLVFKDYPNQCSDHTNISYKRGQTTYTCVRWWKWVGVACPKKMKKLLLWAWVSEYYFGNLFRQ